MQTALARKPEESKSRAASEPQEAPQLSAETAMGASAGSPLFLRRWSGGPPPVQRREAPEALGEEEEKEQDEEEPVVQAKLTIGSANDPAEREADHMADQVMGMSEPVPRSIQPRAMHTPGSLALKRDGAGREESASVTAALGAVGEPLAVDARRFMENRFGLDFGNVRVHTGRQAEASAAQIYARAYTVGKDIYFGAGQYAPATDQGRRLLAHELTHVVQQGGVPPNEAVPNPSGGARAQTPRISAISPKRVQRAGGPLDQHLAEEFQDWSRAVDEFEVQGQHSDSAYAFRVVLMLQGVDGDSFADEDALQEFLDQVEADALDEAVTLGRTGDWALMATKAFPRTWSDRVYDALYLDTDMDAMGEESTQRHQDMEAVAERVPSEVGEAGLPVPYAEAASLSEFHLLLHHVRLDREHVVKDMAGAVRNYAAVAWKAGFYTVWNTMAASFADAVAEGEVVVDYVDYMDFVEAKQQGLQELADRLQSVDSQELMESFDRDVVELTSVALVAAFASTLLGLVPALMYWVEGSRLFDDKLAEVDATIAGEAGENKILRAIRWAYDAGYFGGAGAQLLDGILAHGVQILIMAAGFIIVQYIPFLNIAVDAVVILYSGVDALRALYALYESFAAVAAAQTVVALQRASARMAASMEGDGLRVLMDVLAITAGARGIRTRADALSRGGLSEEEALRQALREATGEEAAALRNAMARQRIRARFDPDGVLEPLLDRGVSAEVVEQALMSGMTPQRLTNIASAVSDAGRVEAIIRYAGNSSSPINALLDAGVPVSRVGEMMDLGLGLRELRACEILLQRTGQAGAVEGLIGTLGRFGAGGVSQLIRLTPEGLVSVYQAGGAGALQTVLDTLALESAGSLAGFGDWVRLNITLMNRRSSDLLNAIGELRTAQRIAETLAPGERVRLSGDAHAPRGSDAFEMAVEDASGNVVRHADDGLARDPAHGNQIGPKSLHERRVGVDLESRGDLPGPIRRDPNPAGGEFIDAQGVIWDVKGFNSNFPPRRGGFEIGRSLAAIRGELSQGENVILDTSNLSQAHLQQLRAAVAQNGWNNRIRWWP